MEKGYVQKTVRSFMPDGWWRPGWSICYVDKSYSKTEQTIRYSFKHLSSDIQIDTNAIESNIKKALQKKDNNLLNLILKQAKEKRDSLG